jgi:RecG-like helicase
MNNFNDKKINKPVGVGSEVLIGGKIDNQHSNVVVDETPELIGLPKSSAELAEELIDYLVTHNHQKVAKIIIQGLESEYIRNFLQNILEIIENYNKNRSKKSFDKKEGFKNFKASIKSGFSGLRKLL